MSHVSLLSNSRNTRYHSDIIRTIKIIRFISTTRHHTPSDAWWFWLKYRASSIFFITIITHLQRQLYIPSLLWSSFSCFHWRWHKMWTDCRCVARGLNHVLAGTAVTCLQCLACYKGETEGCVSVCVCAGWGCTRGALQPCLCRAESNICMAANWVGAGAGVEGG